MKMHSMDKQVITVMEDMTMNEDSGSVIAAQSPPTATKCWVELS